MIYEANTIQWCRGQIVLHDADAKEPKMFMKVIGYTRDGLCKTQYVDKQHKRTIYKNPIECLYDPRCFGLEDYSRQEDFELVRWWNNRYQIGQEVRPKAHIADTFKGERLDKTRTAAVMVKGGQASIWLERGGMWMLSAIEAVTY